MESQDLFDKYCEGRHWERRSTKHAERFARFLSRKGFAGLIVDAGCGSGRDTNLFKSRGFEVLGIDCDVAEINRASARFPECRFSVQNMEFMGLQDGEVGAFFAINVMHYTDMKRAIGEMLRCLRPGGYALIHFNLAITDSGGVLDYEHDKSDILKLVSDFEIVRKKIFERTDEFPRRHFHSILELILRKKI